MLKFKIGDKARIVDSIGGHGFKKGEIVTICSIFDEVADPYYCAETSEDFWFVSDDELEEVK